MNEQEWWATAPRFARYHTWDKLGKVWWAMKPWFVTKGVDADTWNTDLRKPRGSTFEHYDQTPCPIEIDPSATLRTRPKVMA